MWKPTGVRPESNHLVGEIVSPLVQSYDGTQFDFLSEEYCQLFESSDATAFQHPLWLHYLFRIVAPHVRAQGLVVTVRDRPSSGLVLVLPLVRKKYSLLDCIEFADLGLSDYSALVCSDRNWKQLTEFPQFRTDVLAAIRPFDMLRIAKMRQCSHFSWMFDGSSAPLVMKESAYEASLSHSFSTWRKDRVPLSLRKELDRKRRRLERKGKLRCECLANETAIEAAITRLLEIRCARHGSQHRSGMHPDRTILEFYSRVAVEGAGGFSRTLCFEPRWSAHCVRVRD